MRNLVFAIIMLIMAGSNTTSSAQNTFLTDEIIRERIIGSWVVSEESMDYIPELTKLREEFYDNNTYVLFEYADEACTQLIYQEQAGWKIENGVLISNYLDGTSDYDTVVGIDSTSMILLSQQSGMQLIRMRANTCAR